MMNRWSSRSAVVASALCAALLLSFCASPATAAGGVWGPVDFYGTVNTGSWAAVTGVTAAAGYNALGSLTNGAYSYTYRVTATNGAGYWPPSAGVTVAWTGAPTTNAALVTWRLRDGAWGYAVERSGDGASWTQHVALGVAYTSLWDTGSIAWSNAVLTNLLAAAPAPGWPTLGAPFAGAGTTGLVTSADADTNAFLRGDGTWATPSISGSEADPIWGAVSNLVPTNIVSTNTAVPVSRSGAVFIIGGGPHVETDPRFTNWVATNTYVKAETDPSALLVSGARPMAGPLDMAFQALTNVSGIYAGNVDADAPATGITVRAGDAYQLPGAAASSGGAVRVEGGTGALRSGEKAGRGGDVVLVGGQGGVGQTEGIGGDGGDIVLRGGDYGTGSSGSNGTRGAVLVVGDLRVNGTSIVPRVTATNVFAWSWLVNGTNWGPTVAASNSVYLVSAQAASGAYSVSVHRAAATNLLKDGEMVLTNLLIDATYRTYSVTSPVPAEYRIGYSTAAAVTQRCAINVRAVQ